MGQPIDVLPLQGGFIESGRRHQMIGDRRDLLGLQDSKRLGPDVLERCALDNTVIRKELQHVACLEQVLVVLHLVFIHPLLGRTFGRIRIASHVMNQTRQQIMYYPQSG